MAYRTSDICLGTADLTGLAISLRKDADRGIRVVFTIRRRIQDALGWSAGERFMYSVGEDGDTGKIRIEKAFGGYRGTKNGNSIRLTFPAWKELPFEAKRMRHCEYEIEDGALIVTLPDWQ